jgi:hypothetical protein
MARRFRTRALGINPPAEFAVVRGAYPYLNVRAQDGQAGALYHMSDRRQLRAMAEAILRALDEYPRASRRK